MAHAREETGLGLVGLAGVIDGQRQLLRARLHLALEVFAVILGLLAHGAERARQTPISSRRPSGKASAPLATW